MRLADLNMIRLVDIAIAGDDLDWPAALGFRVRRRGGLNLLRRSFMSSVVRTTQRAQCNVTHSQQMICAHSTHSCNLPPNYTLPRTHR